MYRPYDLIHVISCRDAQPELVLSWPLNLSNANFLARLHGQVGGIIYALKSQWLTLIRVVHVCGVVETTVGIIVCQIVQFVFLDGAVRRKIRVADVEI